MGKSFLVFTILIIPLAGISQRYRAVESNIRFYSEAPLEDIKAINEDAASVLDVATGDIVFSVPINKFIFEKSLMQQHFNENYLESDKYPKSLFLGSFNPEDLREGENEITVNGKLSLHGQQREISVTGTMIKGENVITAKAVFTVLLVDYKIKIPKALFYNIAEEIEVTVYFNYEKI